MDLYKLWHLSEKKITALGKKIEKREEKKEQLRLKKILGKEKSLFVKTEELARKRDKNLGLLVEKIGKDKAGGVLDVFKDFFGRKEPRSKKSDWL